MLSTYTLKHVFWEAWGCKFALRELSFSELGTGVEEFLEGYQIFWPRFIGGIKYLKRIVKYLMGFEVWNLFQAEVKIMHSFTTKVSSVSAMFIRQGRSYLK